MDSLQVVGDPAALHVQALEGVGPEPVALAEPEEPAQLQLSLDGIMRRH